MNRLFKKVISSVLAAVMTVGVVGVANVSSVFAEETEVLSLDFSDTTKQGKDYSANEIISNNEYVKVTSVNALTYTSNKKGVSHTTGTNITVDDTPATHRMYLKIDAKKSGTLTINIASAISGSNKAAYIITPGTTEGTYTSKATIGNDNKKFIQSSLDANKTYYFTAVGTQPYITSLTYKAEASTDPSLSIGDDFTLTLGDDPKTITPTLSNTNLTADNITWSSDNNDVATVSAGIVTAVGEGDAIITATVGDLTDTCTVHVVKNVPVTGITVSLASSSIYVEKTTTATATVAPEDATNKTVTWSSSDTSVATVDSSGKITGKTAGTAIITATSSANTEISGRATITVNKIPVVAPSTVSSSTDDLKAATQTTTYYFLTEAEKVSPVTETVVYPKDNLYFNNEILVAKAGDKSTGLYYFSNKTTSNLDGTLNTGTNAGGIRIKAGQDVFAVKLAVGSSIEVPVYSGGTSERYAFISTSATATTTDGALASTTNIGTTDGTSPQTLSYTNTTTEEQIVYVTATADSFFSQVRVTVPVYTLVSKSGESTASYVTYDNKDYAIIVIPADKVTEDNKNEITLTFNNDKIAGPNTVYKNVQFGDNTYTANYFGGTENDYVYGYEISGASTGSTIADDIAKMVVTISELTSSEE